MLDVKELTEEQRKRYSRQIQLPQVGVEGQQKLNVAHALVVGMGGLGCPAAMYLAAAGVGRLILVDYDQVELSNLQRQIAHTTQDIGKLKTESARETCVALNPEVQIETVSNVLDDEELEEQVKRVDIALDCSDNFPTRFALNDFCWRHKVPLVSGAAMRMEGQLAVFRGDRPEQSPCYHCLFRKEPTDGEACSEIGVMSPLVGVIGSLQAMEAVKVLIDVGQDHIGQLLLYDGVTLEWRAVKVPKDPKCPVCAQR
ncbi:MAG: molybdopterin-synthase adenylyltransferase MoeB [Gammaproteobacteria bacterium]|nr:molybdopterin-synthase adenylyltransferase MoeB [Gammaproteobacteria bacterium]